MKARLYTSWNNRKARRFHRKDHRNCQAVRRFHSSEGFTKQTQIHNLRITQFSHPSAKTAFFYRSFLRFTLLNCNAPLTGDDSAMKSGRSDPQAHASLKIGLITSSIISRRIPALRSNFS